MNDKTLNKVATVVARVAEITYWVATGILAAGLAAYCVNRDLLRFFVNFGEGESAGAFEVAGFSVQVLDGSGAVIPGTLIPAMVAGIVSCALMAMIFRNIYLIFKTSAGETKFSKGATPFQPDNVRMLREIGIFSIAIPVWGILCSILVHLLAGEAAETSISSSGIAFGIAALCLSQFFAYGVRLQQEADGLL